jgi:hypothetical protein
VNRLDENRQYVGELAVALERGKRLVSIAVLAMTLACSIVKAGNPETKPRDSLEKIGTYCSAISYPRESAGTVEEKLPWFEAQYYGFSLVVCGYCYHKNAATDEVRKCVADYHGRLPDELAIVAEAYSRFSNGKENIGTLTDISWKWLTRNYSAQFLIRGVLLSRPARPSLSRCPAWTSRLHYKRGPTAVLMRKIGTDGMTTNESPHWGTAIKDNSSPRAPANNSHA